MVARWQLWYRSGVITAGVEPVSGFAGDGCGGSSACAGLELVCLSGQWQHGKVLQVIVDGETRWSGLYWKVLPQELAVAGGYPSRAVNADNILVELANLNHDTRLIPFSGVWASLVLDAHMVTHSLLVCSDHLSAAFEWRFPRASYLVARVSLQVGCG